jgi:exodeoxyribonuclease V alpha subunit
MAMDLFDRARPGAAAEAEVLEGTVERVVFTGGGGAFTVLRLAVSGQRELVTVVGSLLGVPVGARLRVRGHFETDPRFGRQLRASGYTELAPETIDGIRRYLGSGLIKGIGPEFASRIVARFGVRTLEILDAQPERIGEVPGIGRVRAEAVRSAWNAQRQIRDVMVFLQGHGVSPAFAVRIFKRYGPAAIALVRENPYRLAFDVWGIGFVSADKLAAALGIRRDSEARVAAGVRHVLDEAGGAGHVFVPRPRLVTDAAARLEVDDTLVQAAIERLALAGEIVVDGSGDEAAVYDLSLYRAERAVAAGLLRLLEGDALAAPSLAEALAGYEQQSGLTLAPQQAEAIRRAATERVVVITGGPGVGKTTIVRGIVGIMLGQGLRVALAAPTGRAAKRLSEATGQPAATLHRLLEWRPHEGVFARDAGRPLEVDLLVVDEASMLDVRLAAELLAALADGTRLVLVGDVDQLPSVGPGTVLGDVIASRVIPTVRLTEIFRQAASSLIVTNAHRIQEGLMPELAGAPETRDFFFIEEDDPARAAQTVRDLVVTRLPRHYGMAPHDIQVLAPMHRGDLGAGQLNQLLQEALTPGAEELRGSGRLFRTGDRVMQLRNDYDKEVWNGDVGQVIRASTADGELSVRFDDREIRYGTDELDELALAYAATVHKAQGSEYAAVVVPVHTQHYVMLQRNLLYTAITRGKRLVVLVGSRKALALAVRNADLAARCSRLALRLREPGVTAAV